MCSAKGHLYLLFLRTVFLHHEIIDDKVLSFGGILTHVVGQQFLHLVGLMQGDLFETNIRADKPGKLIG